VWSRLNSEIPIWSDDHLARRIIVYMKDRVVCATEFKAKCLALMDELEEKGGTITVTKRGRPVATMMPAKKPRYKSPMGAWVGKIKIVGDIVNEDTSHLWNVLREDID